MVEATAQFQSPVTYAKFRTDQDPTTHVGYSADLVHVNLDPKYYDDLESIPSVVKAGDKSILNQLYEAVKDSPDQPFMGTREQLDAEGKTFGEYQWETYRQVFDKYEEIAKGMVKLDLTPVVISDEERDWRFCGIWAKNRWEWHTTLFACMVNRASVIGFYDSMGPAAVDYCLKQTKVTTMFCTAEYLIKLIDMKKNEQATHITNIVLFNTDKNTADYRNQAEQVGLHVHTLDELRKIGRESGVALKPEEVSTDDVYILNYTSGTTGDSKGVRINHKNVLSSAFEYANEFQITSEDCYISYLPAPHVFEQYIFTMILIKRGKLGFFHGNTLKLTEDTQMLKPTLFPSVPRLYNKIYQKIHTAMSEAKGCKGWLVRNALAAKEAGLAQNAAVTHACYDALVFGKVKAILGGRVRLAITASAPIDKTVLEFLKIALCTPVCEAYGMSETSGATTVTLTDDPISGTVGGPCVSCKIRLKDLPEMDYRIDDKPYPRGEIQMKGPMITKGYFMRPDKTAEAISEDGWLSSGDVGVVFPNGSIKILDRSKNIFKLSQGEYVAPEKLENIYIQAQLIAQIMVYGDSLKNYTVAIVVVEESTGAEWAAANGNGKSLDQLLAEQSPELKKAINDQILTLATANKLNSLEKPKEMFMTTDAFSIENNILTPTFKLKRNIGSKIYKEQIDKMYADLAAKGM